MTLSTLVRGLALCLAVAVAVELFSVPAPRAQTAGKLVLAVQPTATPEQLTADARDLREFLSRRLNRDVEIVFPMTYAGVVEALRFGHAQAAFMSAWPAQLAVKHAKAEVLLAEVREVVIGQEKREQTFYAARLTVRAGRTRIGCPDRRLPQRWEPSLSTKEGAMCPFDPDDHATLLPAETASFASPVPTQFVSSDEFTPLPQTRRQREVEARVKELGGRLARHHGMSRRRFFQTAAGMAAAFVAMNDVYGHLFDASPAEAATPDAADERARALADQFIMDMHTHFLRDDTRLEGFVRSREAVGKAGWNPALAGKPQTLEDLKFANYFKEIYFDSDTKVALISGSGSEEPRDWFLTNEMKAEARAKVNRLAGSRRMLSHAIFMPGMPGWMDEVDRAIADLKPDAFKGYTVGDNTNKQLARHPWRMDDEKLLYPFYDKLVKAGLVNVCVHKGLYPESTTRQFPNLVVYADVRDVGKAAKDWPQLNFVIYHSAFRFTGGEWTTGWDQFERTGRVDWVTDLAEIPAKYGVKNVYGDLGQIFAQSTVAEPRLCAAMMGTLIKGLGWDHVVWGTDAVWTGSPQWQIEALRRLEIPEGMQKQHGFAPLGPADGPVKRAVFGENSARLYRYDRRADLSTDRIALSRAEYEREGPGRTNRRYGFVTRSAG